MSGTTEDVTMDDAGQPSAVAAAAAATATTDGSASMKRPAEGDATNAGGPAVVAAKKPNTAANSQLQQQIQQQLQQQLQAQLQAAAARGQQASITPEQIQAQAQAMVQAAAQAQAVVAAAKSRGDGLVPMSSSQIQALSQIQAQAIVHARKSQGTPQQIQTQIQLQAQALVHAHTQAQIAAGIYKGDDSPPAPSPSDGTKGGPSSVPNPVAGTAGLKPPPPSATGPAVGAASSATSTAAMGGAMVPSSGPSHPPGLNFGEAPVPNSSDPAFLALLNGSLNEFWQREFRIIQDLPPSQTEQDFKNHNDLPLARIKRIMKSDEDVRMISAEAPVLFSKACELFILDLSIRAWNYSQLHKRRTLQKEDIREAIQKTDIFDFLVDVI